jgi:hypothetical protein
MSAAPTKIKRDTRLGPCLLIEILLSHSVWPAGAVARALGNSGLGTCLAGEIGTNRRVISASVVYLLSLTSSPECSASSSPLDETIGRRPSPVKLRSP